MIRYILIDPKGAITQSGVCDKASWSGRHVPLESGWRLKELDEAAWAHLTGAPSTTKWRWIDERLIAEVVPPPALSSVRDAAVQTIDEQAEKARQSWLTPGAGQVVEYEASATDAQRAVASADPLDPADYPWLAAEQAAQAAVGREKSIRDIAEATLAARAAWNTAGAQIKALRREAKLRIAQATDAAEIEAIVGAVTWPTP